MTERKDELCKGALGYLLQHGVANVSLRPMAAQLGTSPRILMFYFKSKERLLQEVLGELHARLQVSFLSMVSADSRPGRVPPLKRFWQWGTSEENFPYLKLLYEVQIIAIQNPAEYARYLKKTSMDWQALSLRALSKSIGSRPMATLCVAVFDGLFLEVMSTGNRRRATQALDLFVHMVTALIQRRVLRGRNGMTKWIGPRQQRGKDPGDVGRAVSSRPLV